MDTLRTLVYEIFLKTFYLKCKKKLIFLTAFNSFHKSYIRTFFNGPLTNVLTTTVYQNPVNIICYNWCIIKVMSMTRPCKSNITLIPTYHLNKL